MITIADYQPQPTIDQELATLAYTAVQGWPDQRPITPALVASRLQPAGHAPPTVIAITRSPNGTLIGAAALRWPAYPTTPGRLWGPVIHPHHQHQHHGHAHRLLKALTERLAARHRHRRPAHHHIPGRPGRRRRHPPPMASRPPLPPRLPHPRHRPHPTGRRRAHLPTGPHPPHRANRSTPRRPPHRTPPPQSPDPPAPPPLHPHHRAAPPRHRRPRRRAATSRPAGSPPGRRLLPRRHPPLPRLQRTGAGTVNTTV